MVGVTMRLQGKDAALAEAAGYIERAQNPRGLFETIGMSLVTSTHRRFETSTAPDGSVWPPSLRVLADGGRTLLLSGRLMRSVTYRASDAGVEVGSNVVYAAIHQFGGVIQQAGREAVLHFKTDKRTGASRFAKPSKADRARKAQIGPRSTRMPARPYLGLDDDDSRAILKTSEQWLAGEGGRP